MNVHSSRVIVIRISIEDTHRGNQQGKERRESVENGSLVHRMDRSVWDFLGGFWVEMGAPDERLPTWKGEAVRANHVDPDPAHSAIEGKEARVISSDSCSAHDSSSPSTVHPPFNLRNTPDYSSLFLS